jgi:hypothetical protein
MQRIVYILLFFVALSQQLSAADVTVTATAATNGSANGELFIQVDNSVTDFPLTLVITYPNGFSLTESLTSYTYQLTGLPAGIYTIQVMNASGCILSLDMEIPDCKLLSSTGSYLCSVKPEVCCRQLFLTGGEDGFNSSTLPDEMTFNAHHSLSPEQFDAIAPLAHQTAIQIAGEVLTNGGTPYDVAEQAELETTAPLVMKFDETGNLVWVWHNYAIGDVADRGSTELFTHSEAPSNRYFYVFPNPTKGNLTCEVAVPKEGIVNLELLTPFGQILLHQSHYVVEVGSVTFEIRDIGNFPAGMYFLKLTNTDNTEKVKRVFFGE